MDSQSKHKLTAAEFEAFVQHPENGKRLLELFEGRIFQKDANEFQGVVRALNASEFQRRARGFARVTLAVHHRSPLSTDTALRPDVAVTLLADTPPPVERGAVRRMPDLAVEVWSPDNTLKSLREKAHHYLANGSRLVKIVYPKKRLVEVCRPDADVEILTGTDLLPGFTLSIAAIFDAVR